MLNILKTTTAFIILNGLNNTTNAQADIMPIRPGSQTDTHGCVTDGGYQWCESTQLCQRTWELPCEVSMHSEFCETSNAQTCRMNCPEPSCPSTQCSMRIDNCCETMCIDIPTPTPAPTPLVCPNDCPPIPPCAMPPMADNCNVVPGVTDKCGCQIGCPSVDCSTHQTQNTVSQGQTCGGYMPYGMAGVCGDGLECVYTMGPMIADAPGTCMPVCPTSRDEYGNCITIETVPQIPHNCVTWYDGCNTCSVGNGNIQGCTMMMCFTQNEPYCQVFTRGDLHLRDMCFRFCEDGSQNSINRQKDCPIGTECSSTDSSMISFDSCGTRAHTCNLLSGH